MANTPPLPSDLFKGPTWLLKYGSVDIPGLQSAYSVVSDIDQLSRLQWRKITFRFTRSTPAGTTEDMAQFGVHIASVLGGQLTEVWNASSYTALDPFVETLWTTLRPLVSTSHTLVDYAYHVMSFNPDLPIGEPVPKMVVQPDGSSREVQRFAPSGPPTHVVTKNQAGTAVGNAEPYQTAMSVTFKTSTRRHWGRVYLPGMQTGLLSGAQGRWDTPDMQTVADAFNDFFTSCETASFTPVIPASQANSKYAAGLNGLTSVVVDDVPDTIRRRRPKMALTRVTGV